MKVCLIFVLTFLIHSKINASVSYEGYKVYQIIPANHEEVRFFEQFHNDARYDFWSAPRLPNLPVTVMVSSEAVNHFEEILKLYNLNYGCLIPDVQRNIERRDALSIRQPLALGDVSFTKFMRYDEINAYLVNLTERYPNLVKTEIIGQTYEGRNITLFRISGTDFQRPTIFIDAGIHAREWIAPAMALYIINQIVENSTYSNMYQNVDWAILTVTNPDGYEFTFTEDRKWRKTRSPGIVVCYGTDGNRNFDFHWNESGSSTWECSPTYAGTNASSESEITAFSKFVVQNKNLIKLYVAVHSYGQYLLYPYSYDNVLPDNAAELQSLGDQVSAAIGAVNGTTYRVGNSAELLYASAGCSDDYSMGVGDVPLAYTIELPGGGADGFSPLESQILPMVSETFEGFKVFHKYVEDVFVS